VISLFLEVRLISYGSGIHFVGISKGGFLKKYQDCNRCKY